MTVPVVSLSAKGFVPRKAGLSRSEAKWRKIPPGVGLCKGADRCGRL